MINRYQLSVAKSLLSAVALIAPVASSTMHQDVIFVEKQTSTRGEEVKSTMLLTSSASIKNYEAQLVKIKRNKEVLEGLLKLKLDWNSNGAKPFEYEHIQFVKEIVSELSRQPQIFPTARESVQLEFHKPNGEYLELEIYKDKSIELFQELADGHEERPLAYDLVNSVVEMFYA